MKKTKKDKLVKLLNFKLNEKKVTLSSFDNMIKTLRDNQNQLENTLKKEIGKHKVDEYTQFTVPPYIVNIRERLQKLTLSIEELSEKRSCLHEQLSSFYQHVKKTENAMTYIEEEKTKATEKQLEEEVQENITISLEKCVY